MKIVQVEYRRLRSFGEYENETVGAVAEVEPGISPEQSLEILKGWVEENFGERASARDAATRVQRLEIREREVAGLLKESEKRWRAAQKILEAAGIDVPRDYGVNEDDDLKDLPF